MFTAIKGWVLEANRYKFFFVLRHEDIRMVLPLLLVSEVILFLICCCVNMPVSTYSHTWTHVNAMIILLLKFCCCLCQHVGCCCINWTSDQGAKIKPCFQVYSAMSLFILGPRWWSSSEDKMFSCDISSRSSLHPWGTVDSHQWKLKLKWSVKWNEICGIECWIHEVKWSIEKKNFLIILM